jgi:hypothetical protein
MKRRNISRRANFEAKARPASSTGPERIVDAANTPGTLDETILTLRDLTLAIRRMLGLHQIAE